MLWTRERAPTPCLSVVFYLGLTFGSPKELGVCHLRFLAPILATVLQHRFKVLQQKVPHSQMHFDFYMPLKSTIQTHVFFITPQHQPLISILISNYTTTQLSHWHSKNSSTTKPVVWTRRKIPKKTCHLGPPFSLLSYLPPWITQTFLQCSRSLHHPSLGAAPILHNTQTNKVAYPCIPCNNDGHIPITSMQKVDG
jgi:hypothetical protein